MGVRGTNTERVPGNQHGEGRTGLCGEDPTEFPSAEYVLHEGAARLGRRDVPHKVHGHDVALVVITVAAMVRADIGSDPKESAERIRKLIADGPAATVVNAVPPGIRELAFHPVAHLFPELRLKTLVKAGPIPDGRGDGPPFRFIDPSACEGP